jgi:hypothetical protein
MGMEFIVMPKTEEKTEKTVEVKLSELLELSRFKSEITLAMRLVPIGSNPEACFRMLTAIRGQLASIASKAAETMETKAGKPSKKLEGNVQWSVVAKTAQKVIGTDDVAARLSRAVKATETMAAAFYVPVESCPLPLEGGLRDEVANWILRLEKRIAEEEESK